MPKQTGSASVGGLTGSNPFGNKTGTTAIGSLPFGSNQGGASQPFGSKS